MAEAQQSPQNLYNALEAGDFARAEDICQQMLENNPNNPEALHARAVMAYQAGKLEKALPWAEKASQVDPRNPHFLNTLGLVQRNLKQPDQALITFQIALTHKPDFGQAMANMALVHLDKDQHEQALACFEKALPHLQNNPDMLTNYAHTLRDAGQTEKAAEVYHQVLALAPQNERFLLNVGAVEMALGREEKALEAYRAVLAQNPEEPTALHIVAGLTGQTTAIAPDKYVEDLFDVYAADFDHHLANLGYQVPQMLGARIPAIMAPRAGQGTWQVLDLGCGTGACGLQVAEHKAHMTGVDLARNMLDKADEHGVYDELLHTGIHDYLEATDSTFDLIFAADVFVYVGDLTRTFELVADASNKGALFCFSTELAGPEEADYVLRATGRYAQSDSFIQRLASENKFSILLSKDITVRKDQRGDIPGKLYILQR